MSSVDQTALENGPDGLLVLPVGFNEAGGQVPFSASSDIIGTNQPDLLNGTSGDDEIRGLAGADEIRANDGDDDVNGGKGADLTFLGNGNDI